jgi:hypothetical protein
VDPDDVAMRELLADDNWRWLPSEKKVKVLLRAKGAALPPALENRISDVRRLRHMLAHGAMTPASIEWTVGGTKESTTKVSAAFPEKFPRIKIMAVDRLTGANAREVLSVVLDAIEKVRGLTGHMLD